MEINVLGTCLHEQEKNGMGQEIQTVAQSSPQQDEKMNKMILPL